MSKEEIENSRVASFFFVLPKFFFDSQLELYVSMALLAADLTHVIHK